MGTINNVKQLAVADTPILFFQCEMPSGDVYHWSSHSIIFSGQQYVARVLKHNLFTLQLSADDAMDSMSQLSIVLGNADAMMSELNAAIGFRGAQLTVHFAFVDLPSGIVTTEPAMLFRGVAGDPQEITEESLTLNFTNKLSLQRVALPDVRIQRTCPWNFPATSGQRQEAMNGAAHGRFSKFYRCGYSADIPGGAGNLNAGQPYTSCDGSRVQCLQRGMFNSDEAGNINNRYGGFEFIPTSYLVRGANDKTSHVSALIDNTGKANDAVPIVYGTGWLKAPVVFARNDGNLTHMEVLLGLGQIQGVLKVVVNDVEIPARSTTASMAATGWYALVSDGSRQGAFNLDFADASGNPLGDPQGSMAVLSVVVPNSISPGTGTPAVQVLMTGMKVDTYDANLAKSAPAFTNNPAWIVLDVLQRAGWSASDLNLNSFYQASLACSYLISTSDVNGNSIDLPRYGCNLILNKRQSAAILVRGIRVGSSLMLRYGTDGLLELLPEGTLSGQQLVQPDGSNSLQPLNGGWPAYEFSDSSAAFSGIARNAKGLSSLILTSMTIAETCNRVSVEFQDENNEYQQDSLSLANVYDSDLIGFEVASQSTAMGLPNFNQATRILFRQLDKSTAGNQFIQFQTSFRALKVRPGDIIAITYEREGFARQPFRVLKLSPSMNYEMVTIMAQVHDDNWYSDNPAIIQASGRQPNAPGGIPRPLLGTFSPAGESGFVDYFDFGLSDSLISLQDGSAIDNVSVQFSLPTKPSATATHLPLLSLSPLMDPASGAIPGASAWYYAVTAIDSEGSEGSLSFTVPVQLPATTNTNKVSLQKLSFPSSSAAFNVYRGASPQLLYRIATNQALSDTFTDEGLPAVPIGPPDSNFDHANIYYRNEYAGPFTADIFSPNTLGWSDMGAVANAYTGMIALVIDGVGKGQEQSILSNTNTTLFLMSAWTILPDASSVFVIAEPAWKLAAISSFNPAQFSVPFSNGSVLQVTGRAANAMNQESNPELAPISRLHLGGGMSDFGLPAMPFITLATPGSGELTLSDVGFEDLTNAAGVTSGTLQLYYWNELLNPSSHQLSQALDATADSFTTSVLGNSTPPFVGQFIQIDQEIMNVVAVSATTYSVFRGSLSSIPVAHQAGAAILPLSQSTLILPFASGFFEGRTSSNYLDSISIPDVRISAAGFFVTNSFGNSQSAINCYTGTQELLRTLSGGQFSVQVNGYLGTQQNAAPPLMVQATHAVRDIRMTLSQPPAGYVVTIDLLQNNVEYCQLTYDPTQTVPSSVVDGLNLPPLMEDGLLTINIALTLVQNYSGALNPGRDLTVTIRM